MTTNSDGAVAATFGEEGIDDAADAFLSLLMPDGDPDASDEKKKPSEPKSTPKPTETPDPEPETDDEPSEPDEEAPEETEEDEGKEKPAEKKYVEDDDVLTKVKVDDEEREVPIKDLKRLYGQEAALTRKSQEVADLRKKADAEITKTATALTTLLQRAHAKADPYTKIDFLVASRELSVEDLKALREEATARFEDVKFLETELETTLKDMHEKQQASIVEQSKACVTALKDAESPHHIPNWGDKTYGELREFATGKGLSKEVFNQITDPAAMKLLHMARQYERGLKKVTTTVVNKTAKKIVKSSNSPVQTTVSKTNKDKAMARLQRDQTQDAAADAFLAMWGASDE